MVSKNLQNQDIHLQARHHKGAEKQVLSLKDLLEFSGGVLPDLDRQRCWKKANNQEFSPQIHLENDSWIVFENALSLDLACKNSFSFFNRVSWKATLRETNAGVCFVAPGHVAWVPEATLPLIASNPYEAFVRAANVLTQRQEVEDSLKNGILWNDAVRGGDGVYRHPTSCIAPDAKLGPDVIVGPDAVIEEKVNIGAGTIVGRGVKIGKRSTIGCHSTLFNTIVGQDNVLGSGLRLGQEGFGFLQTPEGFVSVLHRGNVCLGDAVYIGDNTVIERGSFQDTRIGRGSRIGALCKIGHNVSIGQYVIMVSMSGIGGSAQIGDGCILGGQVGIANGIRLAPGTKVLAQSGVAQDSLKPNQAIGGSPAIPRHQWLRQSLQSREEKKRS